MANQCISFHLSHTNTSRSLSSLDRLHCQRVDRSSGTDLKLIVHHMSQSLVVDTANIYIGTKFFTSGSRVHGFISMIVVTCLS